MLPNPLHFDQICRICLSSSEKLINLFESMDDILSLLVSMTAISVSSNDRLPQHICPFCSHQIKTTHYFILKCQKSDRKLRLSLQNDMDKIENATVLDDDQILNQVIEFDSVEEDEAVGRIETIENEPVSQQSHINKNNSVAAKIEESDKHTESTTKSLDEVSKPQNVCHICNRTFAKPKNLVRHKAIYEKNKNKETDFECTVCGKQMKHINNFKLHMGSHRDFSGNVSIPVNVASQCKNQYLCSICGRACTSRSNLAVHTRRHNGQMTNFCKICGKGYPRSTDLTVHMRQHTGERPFVCSTCNRGFTRSDKLTIHMRTHTGERPYACSGCTRSFAQLSLQNITFHTETCERIGVVGRTGAGKSSLIAALLRIVPIHSGRITIDEVDISTLPLHALRSRIAILPQDSFLFSGTIRENLDPMNLNYYHVWDAINRCHATSLVQSLGGLNANLDIKGSNISAGQKQLLCLARALLRKTKIVVIEGTSNLDADSENCIHLTLKSAFESSTVLLIAHRLKGILQTKRLLVIDDGQIVEEGKTDELAMN